MMIQSHVEFNNYFRKVKNRVYCWRGGIITLSAMDQS